MSRFDHYFDLPMEIREHILGYICFFPSHVRVTSYPQSDVPIPLNLFLSHPILYREASRIFYSLNVFSIDLSLLSRTEGRSMLQNSNFIFGNVSARRRICHLDIRFGRPTKAFQDYLCPAVADMILRGSLTKLHMTILPSSVDIFNLALSREGLLINDGHNARRDSSPLGTKPYLTVLKLLADPDLQQSLLWVHPIHRPFWCAFHDGIVCGWMGGSDDNRKVIPIDWRALIARFEHDHDFRILSVGRHYN
jgi:hypothetical protein